MVAIIGGARGIGRATADDFAARGATVRIGDLDADAAEATATEIGGGVLASGVDVTDKAALGTRGEHDDDLIGQSRRRV